MPIREEPNNPVSPDFRPGLFVEGAAAAHNKPPADTVFPGRRAFPARRGRWNHRPMRVEAGCHDPYMSPAHPGEIAW